MGLKHLQMRLLGSAREVNEERTEMGSEIWVAIISATIAGAFQLLGKRMELAGISGGRMVADTATSGSSSTSISRMWSGVANQASSGGINYGLVVRQVGILQFVLNLIGFGLGLAMGASGAEFEQFLVAVLFLGTVLLIAGFAWISLKLERATMWKHLAAVALGVAIVTVVLNSIVLQVPFTITALLFALAQTFISMGIGGAIANRIRS